VVKPLPWTPGAPLMAGPPAAGKPAAAPAPGTPAKPSEDKK
jgi:hypothetical protein